ncbi:hypothetical protein GIB67_029837 [Kingdonia uniflora]|uniref:ABC transmembrane type-1 domain-containing protein n=1 Tax=Kingdonia uniflora TaxID=39325 RepID=A0A7J7NJ02_9MAGN|nr:hypothetical protein GIB67_029837 [Kingdonia uniflora]
MTYEEASQVVNSAFGSIRTVASFCAEKKVMPLYAKKCEGPMKTGISQCVISEIGYGFSFCLLYSVYATCFYAGARLVDAGKITFSDVFRVFFALVMAAIGISQPSSLAPDFTKAKSTTDSIFEILDRKSKINPSDNSGTTLENMNGHIILDGVELHKFQLRWLRQQMGFVSQEPVLLNDTICANIAYGKEGPTTEADILAASELANAHKFISGLQRNAGLITVIRNGVIAEKRKHDTLINIKDGIYASLVALHKTAS